MHVDEAFALLVLIFELHHTYLTVETQCYQHEEEKCSPQLRRWQLGYNFWICNESES